MTYAQAEWAQFAAALVAFLATHSVPARPAVRRRLRERLGGRTYMVLYSIVSLAVFTWLIAAANTAPRIPLWRFESWQLWVPNIVMPAVCLLIAYGFASPDPFSLTGLNRAAFDPNRPGIAGITRHPILWAVTLWASAHLVANGELAHVILFGLFALFGLAGMFIFDARKRREWGPDLWAERTAHTSLVPFAAVLAGRFSGAGLRARPVPLAVALVLYLSLILLHPHIIGVSPLPSLQT
jgi:uncharacterized membrane protein